MSLHDFEERYRGDPDPWSYESSAYEQAKYQHTLEACGPGAFATALELGCSIGVFTGLLAPRCRRLVAIDGSATALSRARRRLIAEPAVELVQGRIPEAIPDADYDLVVASEILYYLDQAELDATLARCETVLVPAGRLVAVHWRSPGPERPLSADAVHTALDEQRWLTQRCAQRGPEYLLGAWERR
jgi:SAM-dependent methyltransferase